MAERPAALQAVQIGVEAVPGTAVPAGKRLRTLENLAMSPDQQIDSGRRPTGQKFPAFVIPGREWAAGSFDGGLSYSEIVYFLSGIFGLAAGNPSGAGAAKTWNFRPSLAAQDLPKTFTIEQGGPDRAQRVNYGFIPELTISGDPDNVELSGTLMGRAFADNIGAMTAAPTEVELVPVHPSHVSVYLDSVAANIGNTKLLRDFAWELAVGSKYTPVFTVDSAQARGFAGVVETAPAITLGLTMEADAQGMANLPRMRNGDTVFCRVEAIGGVIGAGPDTYKLTIDGAFKVTDMGDFGSEQDVVSNDWDHVAVWDTDLGFALDIEVVNQVAAL